MPSWFTLLAIDEPPAGTSPRDAKRWLARAIVERFHSPEAAAAAEAHFDRVHIDGGVPDDDRGPAPAGGCRAPARRAGRRVRRVALGGAAAAVGQRRQGRREPAHGARRGCVRARWEGAPGRQAPVPARQGRLNGLYWPPVAGRESFEPARRVLQFPVRTRAEASPERASLRRSPLPERARRSLKTQQHAHHAVITSTEWCPGLTLRARQRARRYELTRLTEVAAVYAVPHTVKANLCDGCRLCRRPVVHFTESLILAQDERWRRA